MKSGDYVKFTLDDEVIEGILMPDSDDYYVVKLKSGYNLQIKKKDVKKKESFVLKGKKEEMKRNMAQNTKLPKITIIHTGGTIASKVDYETGAVISRTTPEEILQSIPELSKISNIKTKTVFQMFSEDFEPKHWEILADSIEEEIKKGADGIIIGIGTDTLDYAASAMSFALQELPIRVLFVGSQRSSDRPSTDATMNLICAANYIINGDYLGVGVCMHEDSSDRSCLIIEGNHVKKMHTSRRDTFRPINKRPIARVFQDGRIETIREDYKKESAGLKTYKKFSSDVGIIRAYPGIKPSQFDWHIKNCKGVILEGYAFGQFPINQTDKYTEEHKEILKKIKELAKKMPVIATSQRPYGLVSMSVYSTSRNMLDAGVIQARMQSHVAYVKLSWALANFPKETLKIFNKDICGETVERIEEGTFLI